MKTTICVIFVWILQFSSWSQNKPSEVVYFNYGGFGDDIHAFLIIESNVKELEIALRSEETGQILERVTGKTSIGFLGGWYELICTKEGYDTIVISEYYAVPDQVSHVKLYFAKGNSKINYQTNPPEYLFPKNGTITLYFDNKQLKSVTTYRNDTLIFQERYFENGMLAYKNDIIEPKLNRIVSYYKSGQLEFISIANRDLTEGYRKEYFENGNLKEHLLNTREGQLRWYSTDTAGVCIIENGNTVLEYRIKHQLDTKSNLYRNGLQHGRWVHYYDDGKILWIEEYESGKKLFFEFYNEEGELVKREEY